jgi:hypothetical protein
MIAKTPHKNGKKFIPKLRSLSKINVHNLDFKIVEFVNVTNKSIQFFLNLAFGSKIHYFFKWVKDHKIYKKYFLEIISFKLSFEVLN